MPKSIKSNWENEPDEPEQAKPSWKERLERGITEADKDDASVWCNCYLGELFDGHVPEKITHTYGHPLRILAMRFTFAIIEEKNIAEAKKLIKQIDDEFKKYKEAQNAKST